MNAELLEKYHKPNYFGQVPSRCLDFNFMQNKTGRKTCAHIVSPCEQIYKKCVILNGQYCPFYPNGINSPCSIMATQSGINSKANPVAMPPATGKGDKKARY